MKVIFTSCSNAYQQMEQPIWSVISGQKPDLLLLLGDNVYIGEEGYQPDTRSGETILQAQERILRSKYDAQINEPNFKNLIGNINMLAVWDNHDLGLPGSDYKPTDHSIARFGSQASADFKKMSRRLFDTYIKSWSLKPKTKNVYCSHIMENIKFIMVDTRSLQTPAFSHRSVPFPQRTLLGDDQQEWLESELLSSDSEIKVICSGMAYSEGHMNWKLYTEWDEKFNRLVQKTSKLLFLGGNIHRNTFIKQPPSSEHSPERDDDLTNRTFKSTHKKIFYEIISSGVGRNMNRNGTVSDHDDADGPPANNYGIVEFTESLVKISLHGHAKKNIHFAEIDRNSWALNSYSRVIDHPL